MKRRMKRRMYLISALVLLLLGLLPSAGWAAPAGQEESALPPALEVSDQTLAGGRITLERVASPASAWVVVYPAGEDGSAIQTRILGQAQVIEGLSLNVDLPLTEAVPNESRLVAMLYRDSGISAQFEPGMDEVIEGEDGPLAARFVLTVPLETGEALHPLKLPAPTPRTPKPQLASLFGFAPPTGWVQAGDESYVVVYPQESNPFSQELTTSPWLYLEVVPAAGTSREALVSEQLRMAGRVPQQDEAPLLVTMQDGIEALAQCTGGANQATAFRACVAAFAVPEHPDTLAVVVAWAPTDNWPGSAALMNQFLHSLRLVR